MLRRLLAALTFLSLFAGAAGAVSWVRSYRRSDAIEFTQGDVRWRAISERGFVRVDNQPQVRADATPVRERRVAASIAYIDAFRRFDCNMAYLAREGEVTHSLGNLVMKWWPDPPSGFPSANRCFWRAQMAFSSLRSGLFIWQMERLRRISDASSLEMDSHARRSMALLLSPSTPAVTRGAVRHLQWVGWCALLPAVSTALAVADQTRRRRRRAAGRCSACGYDLRASAGRCPDCGAGAKDRA